MKNKYKTLSKRYLTNARKLMNKGDYLQASEKLWGASAQIVKAYAQARGVRHDGHGKLFQIIGRIARETGDREWIRLFQVANSLHTNFYENWQTREEVESGAEDVEKLVQKIEQLLNGKKR